MADVAASSAAATKCTEILVDKAMKELPYLCCYKSYAVDFERKKDELSAVVESVGMKIEEAKTRNETQIDPIVKHWIQKANNLIRQETTPKKWFGFCTDWFSQCSLAKELDSMMREIPSIMEKAENFSRVALAAQRPGMEFYSQEFMRFKSRNSLYEQLREELKDDNNCRIGLQAMGGSGKTMMAKAVGKELENSKSFDKVFFIEVPNPVDEKKIRDEIEMKLELTLEDDKKRNLTHAEQIWIRIANAGNVLIILDDVWKELNLENIGIHHGIHTQGRCCVLLTTRYETVCTRMRCQKTIKLEVLPEKDAVDLFLYYANENGNDFPNKLKWLASKIVNECGRLPVIVVAVAKTLRNCDPNEWEDAFAATENDSSLRHGNTDEEAKKFYNSLKISFKCLDTKAQDLILLCSAFPRAYEIPVELLSRIAIGLGLCENIDSYCLARSQVLSIKTTLVSSALLLTAREGYVKMHDVIRDVAQQVGDEKIQVIMDSKTKLKENVKYSSWIINDFSNYFECDNLEILLVWVNASGALEVPDAFFGGMKGLRVLFLCSKVKFRRTVALSLPKSICSLENVQTLSLTNWELGDLSILQNLKELQTLELTNCSIIELPNVVIQLEKLKFLGLVRCSIKRNNPFEVIGRCPKLQVLYYVSNVDTLESNTKPSKTTVLQEFGIYHIEGSFSDRSFQLDASTKRYFNSTKLKGILSESTLKFLAARAEILVLTESNETRWTNLIPDMVHPIADGGMNDLTRLSLISWPAIQYLVYTNNIQPDAAIFSNLVELQLFDMCVRELCHGDFPNDFLKQLERLDLSRCVELDGTLFKSKLDLSNLKFVELKDCSMTCLFHPSSAQSLKQLENLNLKQCSKLKCLISDDEQNVDDQQDPNQKKQHSIFPKLKFLRVQECHELEFVLPIFPCKELERVHIYRCNELKYIFGQCLEEGGLYHMENEITLPLLQEIEIANVPKFISIYPEYHLPQSSLVQRSWGSLCCFSTANQLDRTQVSKEKRLNRVGELFTPPLHPYRNLRKMSIEGFSELKSLLSLSTASSLNLLEELTIKKCDELEHIVTDEGHVYNHMNDCSIFSNLKQVSVYGAENLKYLFGKCHSNQKHNFQIELNLPELKRLYLHNVPNMVSICIETYSVKALSLQDISLDNCPQLPINIVMDLSVDVPKKGELSKRKERGKKEFTCLNITKASKANSIPSPNNGYSPPPLYQFNLRKIEINGLSELKSLFTISIASSLKLLETLRVEKCDALEYIIIEEGPNSHGHMNVPSVFPNLQQVDVRSCRNVEYVFPAFYSKEFKDLESVDIRKAEKMKYVFGKCQADQNHNVKSELNLPALKELDLDGLPNMVSICTENYYVKVQCIEDIWFKGCPQLPQTFIDFLVGSHKRQDLSRRKALSFKQKGTSFANLQELPDLRDRPINVLSFRNLSTLRLVECKQLKFVLSASTTRSIPELRDLYISNCEELVSIIEDDEENQQNPSDLCQPCFPKLENIQVDNCKKLKGLFSVSTRSIPELRDLYISNCEELVSIIEDDEENQQNPLDPHQSCFPKLCIILVKQCKKLKYLFSISTCPKLPRLLTLSVEDAPELEQVFGWKQGAPLELVIKDVFPNLIGIRLVNLPSLHTVYQGIDFQTVKVRIVRDCNNIPSSSVSSSELFDLEASLAQDHENFVDNDYFNARLIISLWADEMKDEEEELKEALQREKTISEQNNSTPELAVSEEASNEAVEKDSRRQSSSPNLTENSETSTSEIVEEQLPTSNTRVTPSSKTVKELFEKGSNGDEEALGEGISLNEGPTIDLFTKEATKKVSLETPPTTATTEMSKNVSLETPPTPATTEMSPLSGEPSREAVEKDSIIQKQKSSSPNLTEDNLVHKASSSTHTELTISNLGTSASTKESKGDQEALGEGTSLNEGPQRVKEPTSNGLFTKETSKKIELAIPPTTTATITEITSPLDPSISTPKKPLIAASTTHTEPKSSKSDLVDISITTEYPQVGTTVNHETCTDEEEIKFEQNKSQIFEEHDLMRLFQIMKKGAHMEVDLSYVSKLVSDLHDNTEVSKALAALESSLKMSLTEIATSEENKLHLENALNILSSQCYEDGAPSHGLRAAIQSLQQEIQTILSSFSQVNATIDSFTKFEQKGKLMIEQRSKREEDAKTLLHDIQNTKNSIVEAQLNEAELKEKISKLQAELHSKEKEIKECERKLLSLQEQEKKSVSDTVGFTMEFLAMEKERSQMVEDQMKARQRLQTMEAKWSSCLYNLKKATMLLGVHLKHKP